MTSRLRDEATPESFDAARFLSRDPEYCRQVLREYSPLVLAVCDSYAKDYDHAQDLYQETWLKVYAKARSYRATGSFRAWLGRLARNVCISDFRSRKSAAKRRARYTEELAGKGLVSRTPDPLGDSQRNRLHRTIREAIDELPKRERQALTLRLIEEKSPREVVRIMGVTRATVRSHLRHALLRLRRRMDDPADELSALARLVGKPGPVDTSG